MTVTKVNADVLDLTDAYALSGAVAFSGTVTGAGGINIGTPTATTSGTTIDISIPTGTRAIWVSYDAVSVASGEEIALRLGDSGGVETSEYISYLGSFQGGGTSMASATFSGSH